MSRPSAMLRDGALWGSAALLVLAAHLGGALWLMRQAEAATPPGLPQPVFVELAPMPEAAAPPDETESPEMTEAAPDFVMDEPLPELEPVPDMNSLFPPPPDAVVMQKSDRPKDRPEPKEPEPEPQPKIVKKQPEKKKDKAPEEQEARKASTTVRAPASDRSVAPSQGAQVSPRQAANWQSKVQSAVSRHMQRTRLVGRGGDVQVTVAFTISASGGVSGARMVGSTGDGKMDAALNRQIGRLTRLPPHPSGKPMPITLPVLVQR